LVFYESPHRIAKSVDAMAEAFGEDRMLFLARELTKKFEQHFLGTTGQCRRWLQADPYRSKGEFVLVAAGCDAQELAARKRRSALELIDLLRADLPLKRAVAIASQVTGAARHEVYEAALKRTVPGDKT